MPDLAPTIRIIQGDCLEVMPSLPDCSIDAVVTDPPAGIGFMSRNWDSDRGGRDAWITWLTEVMREALRLAKPGAHAFVWALPRTSGWTHRAIEDAGWQVRDCCTHIFGSGFPKSHNLDGEWEGWGTALKPAAEFWYLARKPLIGSVAANVTAYGTGGINVDGCRIGTDESTRRPNGQRGPLTLADQNHRPYRDADRDAGIGGSANGRWPANLILDEEAAALLDAMSGERPTPATYRRNADAKNEIYGIGMGARTSGDTMTGYGDTGGASRFFYTAKASRAERNKGLLGMPERESGVMQDDAYQWQRDGKGNAINLNTKSANHHPCVKPVDLMQWLVRLVTPTGGTVLDPFLGSGSTGIAADREGFSFIGIEQDPEYAEIARRRIVGDCPLFTTLAADEP